MSYDQINGPSFYGNLAVSTTPVLLKVGGSVYAERIEVIFRPIDGTVYMGFDSSVSSTTGIPVFKNEFVRMESGPLETIYLVTASGTVNVRIGERG
jgi:hypothetical protein